MLNSVLTVVFMVLWALGGFILAQIAQRVVVPILVLALGEKRFASPDAFDGCTLGLVGGFFAFILPVFLNKHWGYNLWAYAIVFVGISLYGVVWLWLLGLGARKREWRIEGDKILGRDGQTLQPAFVRQRQDYFQTDAFNGYSHYFLDLHDNDQKLATNAYTVESAFKGDLAAIDTLIKARRLDLTIVWRAEERQWAVFHFTDQWTPLLCGPLEKLSEEQRNWWRQWLLPRFRLDIETIIEPGQWHNHLQSLRTAYPDFWSSYEHHEVISQPGQSFKAQTRPQVWQDNISNLEWILDNAQSEILAMSKDRFEQTAKDTVGGYATFMYGLPDDPYVKLSPMYGEPKEKKKS